MKKNGISKALAIITVICLLLSAFAAVPVSADTTTPDGETTLYKEMAVGTQTRGNETRLVMKITGDEDVIAGYEEVGFYVTIDGETTCVAVDCIYDSFYNDGNLVTAADLGCTYVAILELGSLIPSTKVLAQGYFVDDAQKTAGDPTVIKGNVDIKLPNVEVYTYRVGNENNVSLSNLFNAAPYAKVKPAKLAISTENVSGTASAVYTANATDWTAGTVKFDGTGTVKMTVDYAADKPVELNLEVVNATNVTAATDATDKDVVLLQNCGLGNSMITVSGGHTFYGNGFKISCSGTGVRNAYNGYTEGFVNVVNGTLDNVQVVSKVFPKGYLFKSTGSEYISEPGNVSDSSDATRTRYDYQWSAIAVSGDSTVSNCYAYGARNNLFIGNGNVKVDNCTFECGALANIQICGNDQGTVEFNDLTTVQYPVTDDFGVGNTMLGGGILIGMGQQDGASTETNPKLSFTGSLNQYNWVSSSDTVTSSVIRSILNSAVSQTAYQHTANGETYVNMGILVLNNTNMTIDPMPAGYSLKTVSVLSRTGKACSLNAGEGTVDRSFNAATPYTYTANKQGLSTPTVTYSDVTDSRTFTASGYNGENGTFDYKLMVKLTDGESYSFDFAKLDLSLLGESLTYTVTDSDGAAVDTTAPIVLSTSGEDTYTLTATGSAGFDTAGNPVGEREIKVDVILAVSQLSIPAPTFTSLPNGTPIYVGNTKGSDWSIAAPVLDGASVEYWSLTENKMVTLDLSTVTATKTTNNTLTITGPDYTLSMTSGAIKSGKTNMWVMAGNKLYVTVSSTSDYVSTSTSSRSTAVSYTFTAASKPDAPAKTSKTFSANKPASTDTTYKYSDLTGKGTLTELTSGGGGCVTGDTMIAMADGTEKAIADVKVGDTVMAWSFEKGCYEAVPVAIKYYHGTELRTVLHLNFANGKEVKVIDEHGFFDTDRNTYTYFNAKNYEEYIGHSFVTCNADGTYSTAKLVSAYVEEKVEGSYSLLTAFDYNFVTEGMLSITGEDYRGRFEFFTVGADMKYDEAAMNADIEKYGLFTYEEFADYLTPEQFYAFCGQYHKVLMGRGVLTYQQILDIIRINLVLPTC